MTLPESLYERYPPAADSFLKFICPLVTDSDLEEIAAYDRGYLKDETLPVLRDIRDNQCLRASLDFQAREVLHLGRWHIPAPSDRTGHIQRAFCGAILLLASVLPDMEDLNDGEEDTLIITLESAEVIGKECSIALLKFLLWSVPQNETSWYLGNRPLYALVILSQFLKNDTSLSLVEREGVIAYFYWAENQDATLEGEQPMPEDYRSILYAWHRVKGDMWNELAVRLKTDYPTYPDVLALADHLTK